MIKIKFNKYLNIYNLIIIKLYIKLNQQYFLETISIISKLKLQTLKNIASSFTKGFRIFYRANFNIRFLITFYKIRFCGIVFFFIFIIFINVIKFFIAWNINYIYNIIKWYMIIFFTFWYYLTLSSFLNTLTEAIFLINLR